MNPKKVLAKKYFIAFHNGNINEVHSYLTEDCMVQYGIEKPIKAREFFKQTAVMISTLKFETRNFYTSPNSNKVLVDFSYTTPNTEKDTSKTIDAIDIISFDRNNKIKNITVIPNQ
ncbi:nuclear transport factor 2 family protein [Hyunsoonleella aestuarii]|uniref:Nuclear transport factor 2 family protein n=1 Tax=Hyunsoonleella aestuarii TaxID=912802 RepID=A0ABP8E843_9FLAO|nr:nuclear transport factor 2 family protein [Hyunsoonleella aestuarii]